MSDAAGGFKEGDVFSDFDSAAISQKCVKVAGVRICAEVIVHVNGIQVCIKVAGLRKCVNIGGNGCFTVELGAARVRVCVRNFSVKDGRVCLRLSVRACVGVCLPWVGCVEKCATLMNEKICVDLFTLQIDEFRDMGIDQQVQHLQLLSAATDDDVPTVDIAFDDDWP